MTESDKPEQSPSAPPPPPPPPLPPDTSQQQGQPQQPYGYGAAPGGYPPPPPGSYPAPPQGGYPPPPQGSYGAGPQSGYSAYGGGPVQQAPKNGLGIASLIVAIVGLLSGFGGVVLGPIAIVLGVIGRGRAKRGEATNGGIALAGIVLGVLSIIVAIIAIVLTVQFVKDVGGTDLYDCLQQAGNDSTAQQECQDRFEQNLEEQFGSVTPSP